MNACRKELEPARAERVWIGDERQLRYWCVRLNCSERQLRAAVMRVGPQLRDVRRAILSGAVG